MLMFEKEKDIGIEVAHQKPYQLIFDTEAIPRTIAVAKLNTKLLEDDCQI